MIAAVDVKQQPVMVPNPLSQFDDHQIADITYCLLYSRHFGHRMPGASRAAIIAKMAALLGIEVDQEIDRAFQKASRG